MMELRITREEMIKRVYDAVELEKKVMKSDNVQKFEDIVGEKISNMAVEMSCSLLDDVGTKLVSDVCGLFDSANSVAHKEGKIRVMSFILAESKHFNAAVDELVNNGDKEIKKDLLSALVFGGAAYKVLQRVTEKFLDEVETIGDEIVTKELVKMLEHNAIAMVKKATDIRKKDLLKKVLGSLV